MTICVGASQSGSLPAVFSSKIPINLSKDPSIALCKITGTCFSPILLLDEVFAHLDINKKRALSLEIENLKIQVFMAGLEESDFMTFNKKSYIINLNRK